MRSRPLALSEHAALLRLLLQLEAAHRGIGAATINRLPHGSAAVRAWRRMDKALMVLKSALEDALYRDHPDDAREIGLPHYGNDPNCPGPAALRLLAHLDRT